MNTASQPTGRRDLRLRTAAGMLLALLALGGILHWINRPDQPDTAAAIEGSSPHPPGFSGLKPDSPGRGDVAQLEYQGPPGAARDDADRQARALLSDAAKEVRKRNFDAAIGMLTAQQPLLKDYPEAYLLIARALEGKRDFDTARDFYNSAANRDPYLADAYWGFATTSEQLNDIESAIGGMRNYLHLMGGSDPYRLRVAQGRSALWEWEAKLGRGPWGPTKGVPPGYTAEEIRRDGKSGVGIKMQVPGTENEQGQTRAEMKNQDKIKSFAK